MNTAGYPDSLSLDRIETGTGTECFCSRQRFPDHRGRAVIIFVIAIFMGRSGDGTVRMKQSILYVRLVVLLG